MSKRQGDQREHSFLDKKYFIKGKINSLWTPKNITAIDGWYYEAIDSSISQEIFSYLKMLSMQCRKNIRVKDNKKRMSKASYINMYIYVICGENDSK